MKLAVTCVMVVACFFMTSFAGSFFSDAEKVIEQLQIFQNTFEKMSEGEIPFTIGLELLEQNTEAIFALTMRMAVNANTSSRAQIVIGLSSAYYACKLMLYSLNNLDIEVLKAASIVFDIGTRTLER